MLWGQQRFAILYLRMGNRITCGTFCQFDSQLHARAPLVRASSERLLSRYNVFWFLASVWTGTCMSNCVQGHTLLWLHRDSTDSSWVNKRECLKNDGTVSISNERNAAKNADWGKGRYLNMKGTWTRPCRVERLLIGRVWQMGRTRRPQAEWRFFEETALVMWRGRCLPEKTDCEKTYAREDRASSSGSSDAMLRSLLGQLPEAQRQAQVYIEKRVK